MPALKRHTAERLERILDAGRVIIRETGDTGFTMKDVAVRAKVAPATVFNLLGSKDGLFYALLSRLLDDLFIGVRRYTSPDPLEHAIEATDFVVDAFLADPVVFRELFLVFLGTRDEMHRPWFLHRSLGFWRHSVEVAGVENAVPAQDVESDELPRTLMLGFIGAFYLWVHGDIDDAGFRAQALYGTALTIIGASNRSNAGRVGNRLREIQRQLPKHHTFLRHLIPGTQKGSRSDRSTVRLGPGDADPRPLPKVVKTPKNVVTRNTRTVGSRRK